MEPAIGSDAVLPNDKWPVPINGTRLILIGYWEGDDEHGWPRAADFVDENWDDIERQRVAAYLEEGSIPWACMGVSLCRFCGRANGSAERTDGTYIWPEGLAHYVREHGVRLPASVVRYMISREDSMHPDLVDDAWWRTATLDS